MARQMNYQQASSGSGRGISAGQWNGFLDMHRDYYNGGASNGPLPPILSKSVIAQAVLTEDSEDILPFQPVRITKQLNYANGASDMPSYIVEAVDTVDTDKHGNYGFTLGEGMTERGGRIVVSGIALVAIVGEEVYYDKAGEVKLGTYDSACYVVPDETLSQDTRLIAPTGHFRILSWFDTTEVGKFESDDTLYIAIDMSQRPTSFNATTTEDVAAATEATDIFTWESAAATPMFPSDQTSVVDLEMDISSDEAAYEIQVYNGTGAAVQIGEHLVSYSLEYNRFIIASAGSQTSKIGKADADITAGSTGTVSIWRDGADTTEDVTGVKLDWMAGTTQVSSGKEVMITWFADESIWRITGAECEDA